MRGAIQPSRMLPIVHTIIKKMIDAGQLEIGRELIVHFQFKKILQLGKAKIFLAIAYSRIAVSITSVHCR